MSVIEANVTITVPDGVSPHQVIAAIQNTVSQLNGRETRINIVQVDDPLSLSPIRNSKWGTEGD